MSATLDRPKLLNEREAADYIGLKPSTLTTWRSTGRYDLPFIKAGRLVRYRVTDLDRFLEARTVNSTRE